jgi:transcriptional regulator with XRE-family HTH domain
MGVIFMDYIPDYRMIGQRIKNKRLKMGLTQEKLAEKASVSIQHLSKIETGYTKLSLPCLICIANTLETTVDHLLLDSVPVMSKTHLLKEVEEIYADCTLAEVYILIETSKTIKKSIRVKRLTSEIK